MKEEYYIEDITENTYRNAVELNKKVITEEEFKRRTTERLTRFSKVLKDVNY